MLLFFKADIILKSLLGKLCIQKLYTISISYIFAESEDLTVNPEADSSTIIPRSSNTAG